MQEKLEQVSDFNEWYPVGWIGDICYLYNNEVAFLNFRNSIVDLESHEVMFVDRSGEGCVGFYQMYTLDELIETECRGCDFQSESGDGTGDRRRDCSNTV